MKHFLIAALALLVATPAAAQLSRTEARIVAAGEHDLQAAVAA